jgi:hypothetical protein
MFRKLIFAAALTSVSAVLAQEPQSKLALSRVVALEYPWIARMAVLKGSIELTAVISPDGTVAKVLAKPGPSILVEPAKENLAKWLFTGCASDQCEMKFVYSFVLNGLCRAGTHCPTDFQVDFPGKVTITAAGFYAIVN